MDSHEEKNDADGEGTQNIHENSDSSASNVQFSVPSVIVETVEENSLPIIQTDASCKNEASGELEDKEYLSTTKHARSVSYEFSKPMSGQKKVVHFADDLGLDLIKVHFPTSENVPVVPESAFADLYPSSMVCRRFKINIVNTEAGLSVPKTTNYSFVPQFNLPGSDSDFLDKVRLKRVCLENTFVHGHRVTGMVRIMNIGFEKTIQARYTANAWLSHNDIAAVYVSSEGQTDKFQFVIEVPEARLGDMLSFAIRYVVGDEEFWDNNEGKNYAMKCELVKSTNLYF